MPQINRGDTLADEPGHPRIVQDGEVRIGVILDVNKPGTYESILGAQLRRPLGRGEVANGFDGIAGDADVSRVRLVRHAVEHHPVFDENIVGHKKAITMPMAAVTAAITQNLMVTLVSGQPGAS